MKDLGLSAVGVIALAIALGLLFRLLYPRVELTSELAALFAFVALLLRLAGAKLLPLLRRKRPTDAGPRP